MPLASQARTQGWELRSHAARIALITVMGLALAVAFHSALGHFFGRTYPFDTFLMWPQDRMSDFFKTLESLAGFDPYYSEQGAVYFPITFFLIYPFTLLPPAASYVLFCSLVVGTAIAWFWPAVIQKEWRQGRPGAVLSVLALTLLSYPMIFFLDRGNFEGLVFVFLAISLWAYRKERLYASAAFLGVSIAMKLFPAVFLALFLRDRKTLKAGVFAGAVAVAGTLGSFALLDGGLLRNYQGLQRWLGLYTYQYTVLDDGFAFGHSLWGLVKALNYAVVGIFRLRPNPLLAHPQAYTLTYLAVVGASFLGLTCVIHRRRLAFWKQVALLVLAMNLFPFVSADYKLIHLFLPLALFLGARENEGERSPQDRQIAVLFGLLLVPKAFLWLRDAASLSVVINPILMLLLMKTILLEERKPRVES